MSTKDLALDSLDSLEPVIESEDHVEEDDASAAYSEDTDPSVANGTTSMKESAARNERESLGAKETRNVLFLRFFAFFILLLTSILVCLGVYFYTKRDEEEDFEYVYEASAERLIQSFHESVSRLLAGVDAGAVAITSYALDTGTNFPYVTVPDWELRAANTRVITKSITCQWFPLVQEEDRLGWEAFATATHTNQIETFLAENEYIARQDSAFGLESAAMIPGGAAATAEQGSTSDASQNATEETPSDPADDEEDATQPLALFARPFSPQLISLTTGQIQANGTGPYMPFWQTSPALPFPILPSLNILSDPEFAPFVNKVIETNMAYLSYTIETADLPGFTLLRGQYRHNQELFLGDAFTTLTYPVFDNFTTSRQMVGVVLSDVYWRLHLEQVLPPNARGVIAVLENNVNQSFTYRLDGPDVTYMGEGDLHDDAFDHMRVSAVLTDFLSTYASAETQGFTAVPLTGVGVQYSLHVYPSQDMKDDFVTKEPIIFSLVVAMVFVFTSGIFFIYNVLVERRQKLVLDRAVKSTAVVSSLFPENVKEQLLNEQGEDARDDKRKVGWRVSDSHLTQDSAVAMMSRGTRPKGKPIADRFENTTIMFADIAGFTSWSAAREPEHVFELLETLYGAFDALALARSVFKVETIGDCYLAITGIPKPQPDHALRMAKFARDCMHKVKELIDCSLAASLGEDTRDLSFRVGLHSGSVTAGVLRGDKSRFQLFGDTVNTAARMESNGIKGCIHISQSTADEIIQSGKPGWIVPRQDKIHAKGKGDLQTYFMDERFMKAKVGKTISGSKTSGSEIGSSSDGEVSEGEED
jgi:class 3 adenylate cyclase